MISLHYGINVALWPGGWQGARSGVDFDLWPEIGFDPTMLLGPLAVLATLVAAVALVRALVRRRQARAWRAGATYVEVAAPPQVDPDGAVQLWRHLAQIERGRLTRWWLGQPHVVFEYCYAGPRMTVRIWVPGGVSVPLVRHAVGGGTFMISGGIFQPKRAGTVPDLVAPGEVDIVRGLVEAGVSTRRGDRAVVQIVACPASRARVRRARKAARGTAGRGSLAGDLLDLVSPRRRTPPSGSAAAEPAWITEWRKKTAARLAEGTLWDVGVRYAAAGASAKPVTDARAGQLGAALGAMLGPAWRRRKRRRIDRAVNTWARQHGPLLTCGELAALAHVPSDLVVPALSRAGARLVAPVPEVPTGGRGTKTLGRAAVGGHKVALSAVDARYHCHVIGSTGSGKSTFLLNCILADIRSRRGTVVIDPKGDLIRDILDRLTPSQAARRLVIIDPDQPGARPGLPPLASTVDPEIAIDHLVGICRQIWERHWGPRADDILRSTLRTQVDLQVSEFAGLSGLPTLLTDRHKRQKYTANLKDPDLYQFWKWFDGLGSTTQAQAVGPVLARLRSVLGRDFVRDVIGNPQQHRCFDLARALDGGGIVLCRIPKGQLGDDTAKLLGSILVAKIWQCATARQGRPEAERRDAVVYLDEAQNFLNLPHSLEDILAEARGLRLSMVLAHQHLAQFERQLQLAVTANCRNKVYFTTSPEDAYVLARHTAPVMSDHDLAHLPAYHAAARTVEAGLELPPFTLATLPAPEPVGRGDELRAMVARFPAYTSQPRRGEGP